MFIPLSNEKSIILGPTSTGFLPSYSLGKEQGRDLLGRVIEVDGSIGGTQALYLLCLYPNVRLLIIYLVSLRVNISTQPTDLD